MELLGISIPVYAIWIIAAIIFLVVEISTTALVSVWFIPACLVTAISSVFIDNALIQVFIFLAVSAVSLPISRKIYKNNLKNKDVTNMNSVIGKTGLVTKTVSNHDGRIIIGDVYWEARSKEDNLIIPENSLVQVVEVEKLTVFIIPVIVNN